MLNNKDHTLVTQLFSQSFKQSKYSETCAEKSNYKSYLKFLHIFDIHVPCVYFVCFKKSVLVNFSVGKLECEQTFQTVYHNRFQCEVNKQ